MKHNAFTVIRTFVSDFTPLERAPYMGKYVSLPITFRTNLMSCLEAALL